MELRLRIEPVSGQNAGRARAWRRVRRVELGLVHCRVQCAGLYINVVEQDHRTENQNVLHRPH